MILHSCHSPWHFPWCGSHGGHKKTRKGKKLACNIHSGFHEAMVFAINLKKAMFTILHSWRSPWTNKRPRSSFCTHGVRHEAMVFSMDFEAWKITERWIQFLPLSYFFSLFQHDSKTFSTSFSSINRLSFLVFRIQVFSSVFRQKITYCKSV